MTRRNGIMAMIANNPTLAETWRPEAIAETQQQIAEQLQSSSDELQIPLSAIHLSFSFTPNRLPLRYHYDLDQIHQWAEADIKPNGILSPLWVRPLPGHEDDATPAYELIAGMRRYLAAQHLGLVTVPAKVFNWDNDRAYQAAAAENLNRKGFTLLEELDHILQFLSRSLNMAIDDVPSLLYRMANAAKGNIADPSFLESEPAQIVQQVFAALGQMSWRTFVEHRLRLRKQPPDILTAIREGQISYPKAMEIAKLKDEPQRLELLSQAKAESLTLDAITERVSQLKQAAIVATDPNAPIFDNTEVSSLQQSIKQLLKHVNKNHPIWHDNAKAKKLRKHINAIRELLLENEP